MQDAPQRVFDVAGVPGRPEFEAALTGVRVQDFPFMRFEVPDPFAVAKHDEIDGEAELVWALVAHGLGGALLEQGILAFRRAVRFEHAEAGAVELSMRL